MNEKLTLQDVTDKLAARAGVTKKVSDDFLREFFLLIADSLEKDGLVKIKGLGTFKLKSVDERKSVSVQTGAEMVIPAHVRVTYTPDKALSAEINKPYAHLQTYILDQDGPVEDTSFVDGEDQDGDESDKVDNSIFLNTDKEGGEAGGNYYFNDEEVLADQRGEFVGEAVEAVETVLSSANGGFEDVSDVSSYFSPEEPIPSILEAQPQEGQIVTVFTETESVIGTPLVNPGPVVTLITDEDKAEEASEIVERPVVEPVANLTEADAPKVGEVEAEVPASEPIAESGNGENGPTLSSDGDSSQNEKASVDNSETTEKQSDEVVSDEPEKTIAPDAPVVGEKGERRTANVAGFLVFFCILLLLGLVGYLYKDELRAILGFDQEKVEVVPPVVEVPDDPNEGEPIYDDMSDARVSGGLIQHNDEGTLDELPAEEEVAVQYSFAPEFVQYMKENYPDEDITISGIRDEVRLTPGRRLVDLSLRYYGHKYFWVYIYFFNKDVIKNPNKLVSGMVIKVPDLSPSLVDKDSEQKLDMAFEIKKIIGM